MFGRCLGDGADTSHRPPRTWVRWYATITPGFATRLLPVPNRSHRWLKFARWELWGQCRKHASPEGTTTSWIQSFVISKGWGEARNSYFYIKCYLLPHTCTHHIREQRKRFDLQVIKSTRLVSHEFVISISDCILMTWFFTYLFSENGCLKWAGNPDSPPISYDLRPNTGFPYDLFSHKWLVHTK